MIELIKQSVALDRRFIKVSKWSTNKKAEFLISKYLSVAKHLTAPFHLGKSNVKFDGKYLYYDSKFGLAGYQSMLSRHQYMLQVASVKTSEIKTIIDCGANVGFFSLMAHDLYPNARIFALEPVPKTLESLKKNVGGIGQITTSSYAISDQKGAAYMSFDEEDSVTSKLSSKGKVKVDMITLDEYCRQQKISRLDMLKIDTESFEAHVLRGAPKTLKNTKYLFLEVTLRDHGNYTMSSIMSLLHSNDYDFQLIAYRNYSNKSEGRIDIMDCLLRNIKFKG